MNIVQPGAFCTNIEHKFRHNHDRCFGRSGIERKCCKADGCTRSHVVGHRGFGAVGQLRPTIPSVSEAFGAMSGKTVALPETKLASVMTRERTISKPDDLRWQLGQVCIRKLKGCGGKRHDRQ